MGGVKSVAHGVIADELTTTKNGNTMSVKNLTSSIVGGEIPYVDSSGIIQQLNPGTSGQVLTSAGSGSAPTWATPSTYVLIDTQTLGSANTTITFSSIPTGYKFLKLIGQFVKSSSDVTSILLQFNADTTASNYQTSYMGWTVANTLVSNSATAVSGVKILNAFNINSSSVYSFADVEIYQLATNSAKAVKYALTNSSAVMEHGFGQWKNVSNEISSIAIVGNQQFAGTVTIWKLYGVT